MKRIRSTLRQTPAARPWRALRNLLALLNTAGADMWAYACGSGLFRRSPAAAQAQVLKTAHRIDKGLALPQPRPGFGQDALLQLDRDLLEHALLRGPQGPDWAWAEAVQTLQRYRLQQSAQAATSAHAQGLQAEHLMRRWALESRAVTPAGRLQPPPEPALVLSREDLQRQARGSLESLVRSRRSIRQFSGEPIARGAIEEAVWLASHAPSVCNRSGARAWVVQDAQRRARLLRHQNGHQGFGDQASALLVISVRPEVFLTVEERHQGWIDGGLFAMTLILSLHRQGLGTCCLNWCVKPAVDAAFKREAGLPAHEMVVMLLAVGTLPETLRVAHSPRRPMRELLTWLDEGMDMNLDKPSAPPGSPRP